MDAHSLELLEFPFVRQMLAEEAVSPFGAEAALALHPFSTFEEVEAALEETSEARALLAQGGFSFQGVFDIRGHVQRARLEGASLSPQELLEVASTLSAALRLKTAIQRLAPAHPRLQEKARRLASLGGLVEAIDSVIVEGGYVVDTASEALRLIREEFLRLRERIQTRLQAILGSPRYQPAVAEPLVTVRNDRYVIPVRPNYRSLLRGVVQDVSQSGQTFFLEPEGVVELNNRLLKARRQEEEEVRKVLLGLTGKVRQHVKEIEETLVALAELDLAFEKARLAERWRGSRPKLVREGRLLLLQACHPILIEQQRRGVSGLKGVEGFTPTNPSNPLNPDVLRVVPIDVSVGEKFKALVITGPNTGGKTVALKTVGLLSAMALSGLHIPASPDSQIPFFNGIYADIGDEQSIEQNLSTFSSHLSQIVRILEAVDGRSLVLLDELGAGTDPAEGAALGIAILEGLLAKGATVLAATHLDAIKAYAYAHPQVENACVLFDLDSLKPLYKLTIGSGGRSYAVEIAARLGLAEAVVQRARELLGKQGEGIPALLDRLQDEWEQLRAERAVLERERKETAELRIRSRELFERLRVKEADLHGEIRQRLQEIVSSARKEAERLIAELRRQEADRKVVKEVREALEAVEAFSPPSSLDEVVGEVGTSQPKSLSPGQKVWVRHLRQGGVVVEGPSPRGLVEIQLPLGKVKVPQEVLTPLEESPERSLSPPLFLIRPEEVQLSPELNLIGMTAEEAVKVAERYLDDAFLAGLTRVRIVHGKGTGALRRAVEGLLKLHPLVVDFRLADFNEGGAGATVVELQSKGG